MTFFAVLLLPTVAWHPPPNVTDVQKNVFQLHAKEAVAASDNAKTKLLKELDDKVFRKAISSFPFAQASAEDLLDMIVGELHHSDLTHNIDYQGQTEEHEFFRTTPNCSSSEPGCLRKITGGGVPLPTIEKFNYMPTLWDSIAEGELKWKADWELYNTQEVMILKYPRINQANPGFPAAWDRPVYTALNIWKLTGGEFTFGNLAFIVDRQVADAFTFASPMDIGYWVLTGCVLIPGANHSTTLALPSNSSVGTTGNCLAWNEKMGVNGHMLHTIHAHLHFWGCSLGSLFERWYGNGTVCAMTRTVAGAYSYIEAYFNGGFNMPSAVKLMMLEFDQFFAKPKADYVLKYALKIHRPVGYAKDNNPPWILAPNATKVDGKYIATSNDKKDWEALWKAKATWATVLGKVVPELHIYHIDFMNRDVCNPKNCVNCRFLGVNAKRQCMYWK